MLVGNKTILFKNFCSSKNGFYIICVYPYTLFVTPADFITATLAVERCNLYNLTTIFNIVINLQFFNIHINFLLLVVLTFRQPSHIFFGILVVSNKHNQ